MDDLNRELLRRMEEIKAAYVAKLPARIAEVEQLWPRTGGEPEAMTEFHRGVHSLAGNGASFGAPEVSRSALLIDGIVGLAQRQHRALSESESAAIRGELDRLLETARTLALRHHHG